LPEGVWCSSGVVQFQTGLDGRELVAEQVEDVIGRASLNRKPRAALRAPWGERRDDSMTVGEKRRAQLLDVAGTVGLFGEEVQHGAVVPDGVAPLRMPSKQVAGHPVRLVRIHAETTARKLERSGREIQHGDVGVPGGDQKTSEAGRPAPDIDDRRVR